MRPREPRPPRDARHGDAVWLPQSAGELGDSGEPAHSPDPRPGAGHPDGEALAGSRGRSEDPTSWSVAPGIPFFPFPPLPPVSHGEFFAKRSYRLQISQVLTGDCLNRSKQEERVFI
ncbi:hypothetical protein Bca52824_025031 [Brassica carinata]|uniref:Uncharacterized protein n=1 Tax=Brassica carinata TaxID=52824 RepID=A0A8X7VLL3_BRACI|nr:hypothetical protein Bca52824_025031 [Brassica carinata]